MRTETKNVMRAIRVEKVVLNVGCGTKLPVETAKTILELVSGKTAVITTTKRRNTFNVPKNKPIGCKVTVRKGVDAFLARLLEAKENALGGESFDAYGNFAFGIREYIDIPGMEYDPKTGIIGMDVCVSLERTGFRVKRRRLSSKIGRYHRIPKEEAIAFMKERFGTKVE